MKNIPYGDGTPWPTSAKFFNYLRGCLRKAWSTNPIKIQVLNRRRYQIPNPNSRGKKATVWGADCSICESAFPMSEIQVDHITPAGGLQCREDIQGFVERLLFVTEDDLRLVCKGCHAILSYADKHKTSFDEAKIMKQAKSIIDSKKDKEYLLSKGIEPASNQKKRREQIEKYLRMEYEKNIY